MRSLQVWQPLKLGAISAANIGSNLLFQWLLLTMIGPGMVTDALFAAMTLPQLFVAIISSSLTQVLVPILAGESHEDQRRDAWTMLVYATAFFALTAIGFFLTVNWWVPLAFPGFSADAKLITMDLARINILGMMFTGVTAVQVAIGFARQKYYWVDVATLLANTAGLLLLVWLVPQHGVWAAAWISVLRLLIQTLLLQPLMGTPVMPDRARPIPRLAWLRLKPIIVGASYYKMDPLVDRFLLSAASTGSMSLLYIAQQLHSAASQIITKAFAVPAITQLAAAHKAHNLPHFEHRLTRTLQAMLMVCSLTICLIGVIGQPLIFWGMARDEFTIAQAHELWILLLLSGGMFVAGAMGNLTAGAFYAQGDTRTPTWLGSLAFTVGIALKIAMFNQYGVRGLAAAVSIYYFSSLAIQWIVLRRRSGFASSSQETCS